jgi:EpsI family protein
MSPVAATPATGQVEAVDEAEVAVAGPGEATPRDPARPGEGDDARTARAVPTRIPSRLRVYSAAALVLIGLAGILPWLSDRTPPVQLARPLISVAHTAGGWEEMGAPPADAMPLDPGVVSHLYRTYRRGNDVVWLSVGFSPSLASGKHPQAQKLVLPAHGYAELTAEPVDIALDRGTLTANQLVMRAANRQVATLYWYHVGGRSVAGDHAYRALLLYNRLWHRRSDVALIRVVSPVPGPDPAPVIAAQADFVRALYPELRRSLPE